MAQNVLFKFVCVCLYRLLKPLGSAVTGGRRGEGATQDSASSFLRTGQHAASARSGAAAANGTANGDSSGGSAASGNGVGGGGGGGTPAANAGNVSGRAGGRSRASGVRFGDGVAEHDGDSRDAYEAAAAGDSQSGRAALGRRSRRLSVGGGELRAPHLQRKSMADMLKSSSQH